MKKLSFLAIAVAALFLASCQQDDETFDDVNDPI